MALDRLFNLGFDLFSGISILLLVSIGLAVIFGMRGIINLAHGEFIMLGAFATLSGVRSGLNVWLAMLIASVAVGIFGLVLERLLTRRLYGRLFDTMLATWGVSLILVQVVDNHYGSVTEGIRVPVGSFTVGEFSMSAYNLILMGAAAALTAGTFTVMRKTRYRLLARAATQSPTMAQELGVNTSLINMWTFGLGSALAGAAGALLAPLVGVIPTMGHTYVARSFMTVNEPIVLGAILIFIVLFLPGGVIANVAKAWAIAGTQAWNRWSEPPTPPKATLRSEPEQASPVFDWMAKANGERFNTPIATRNVTKRFGGLTAVDNVTLEFPPTGVSCLIGPNGAGKSTLFGLLSGQYSVTDGSVLLEEQNLTKWPAFQRARLGAGLRRLD